jgi:uncharacterized membrane protein YqaE (UPF0057 family)
LKATANKEGFFLLDAVRILCAVLLPPLAVYLTTGHSGQFWLSLALTVLGFVPGMVHAIWLLTARGGIAGGAA